MPDQVDVHEAAVRFSRLVERVERGEEVVIVREGRPVARLVAASGPRSVRTPGAWAGRVWFADDEPEDRASSFYDGDLVPPREETTG